LYVHVGYNRTNLVESGAIPTMLWRVLDIMTGGADMYAIIETGGKQVRVEKGARRSLSSSTNPKKVLLAASKVIVSLTLVF